jgi:hypothetical protein
MGVQPLPKFFFLGEQRSRALYAMVPHNFVMGTCDTLTLVFRDLKSGLLDCPQSHRPNILSIIHLNTFKQMGHP